MKADIEVKLKSYYLKVIRPDISFAISVVSQFMSAPRFPYWDAGTHILRHLKSAPGKGLLYRDRGHLKVKGYSDADWVRSVIGRRSTYGYCVY